LSQRVTWTPPKGNAMNDAKSSISDAQSYTDIGRFWDDHSLVDVWDQTEPVNFTVDIRSNAVYFPLELNLSRTIRDIARQRGISGEALLNEWVREKAAESETVGAAE